MRILITLLALAVTLKSGDAAITWTTPSGGTGTHAIAENQATGTVFFTFAATSDGTLTAASFALETPTAPFAVANNGDLTITAALDFETTTSYTLEVSVIDDTSTSRATLSVTVTDINDVSPVFAQDQYVATVPDDSTAGTSVISVSATDQDTVGSLTYSIPAGDFSIDGTTGAVTVKAATTLDASTTGGYQITVTVSDGTTTDDTCTLWIAVIDCSTGSESGSTAVVASLMTVFVSLISVLH